jgi:DNA-binding response OmpR family regulator
MAQILIIDDEQPTTRMLAMFLQVIGHKSEEAFNCKQGWDKLLYLEPDVILLDIMLPDKSGLEMCRELRENPATAEIPIIMISAFAPPKTDEASKMGANGYLIKPIKMQDLKAELERLGL